MKHVEGEGKGTITLYAISTCGWCHKTKQLLEDLGVAYDYVDVDLLNDQEKNEIVEEVKDCNPKLTYPTLKINDTCILGFKKEQITEALNHE